MKKKHTAWERFCVNHTSDRRLRLIIYKDRENQRVREENDPNRQLFRDQDSAWWNKLKCA